MPLKRLLNSTVDNPVFFGSWSDGTNLANPQPSPERAVGLCVGFLGHRLVPTAFGASRTAPEIALWPTGNPKSTWVMGKGRARITEKVTGTARKTAPKERIS